MQLSLSFLRKQESTVSSGTRLAIRLGVSRLAQKRDIVVATIEKQTEDSNIDILAEFERPIGLNSLR